MSTPLELFAGRFGPLASGLPRQAKGLPPEPRRRSDRAISARVSVFGLGTETGDPLGKPDWKSGFCVSSFKKGSSVYSEALKVGSVWNL